MALIDTHSHCAWGIDDGIADQQAFMQLIEMAKQDGISAIIATPHLIPGMHDKADVKRIKQRLQEAQAAADALQMKLYAGAEIMLNAEYMRLFQTQLYLPLGASSYVLVEFDAAWPLGIAAAVEERLYELIVMGLRPLIAHAERYFRKRSELSRIQEWVSMGCVIQVNRTSLLGHGGRIMRRNALALIEQGLAHIVATDAHRVEGKRIERLSDVESFLKKHEGEEIASLLLRENPGRILRDEKLISLPAVKHRFIR